MDIMTTENERWDEFIENLEGEKGCNFTGEEANIKWSCNSDKSRPLTRKILEEMGNIDIEKTMKYFDEHGGYCDCEILFNVDR
uniref:DUF2695 domain-containing protein n=1 Tax=viral metagenome TaxID=1070528 RepID=A0A6H1ZMW2_9ZZZZ